MDMGIYIFLNKKKGSYYHVPLQMYSGHHLSSPWLDATMVPPSPLQESFITAPYSFQCPQTRCWWNLYFLEKHVYKIWICWWMYASDMAWRTIPLVVDLHKLGLDIDELSGHRSLGVLRLEVLLVRLGVGHGRPACNHYHYIVWQMYRNYSYAITHNFNFF